MWALPWRVVDVLVATGVVVGVDDVDAGVDVGVAAVVVRDGGTVVEMLLHDTVDNGEAIDVSSISPGVGLGKRERVRKCTKEKKRRRYLLLITVVIQMSEGFSTVDMDSERPSMVVGVYETSGHAAIHTSSWP